MREVIKKMKIDRLDIEELACKILGIDYDEIDGDTATIENKIYEDFNIDLDIFNDIVSRLLPLIDMGKSPLTKKRYKGFADNEKQAWLVKMEV